MARKDSLSSSKPSSPIPSRKVSFNGNVCKHVEPERIVTITCPVLSAAILSSIGGFLFGYNTVIVSGSMIFIREFFDLSSILQEVVVSSTILSAGIASMLAFHFTDHFGRKPVVIFSALVFFIGAVLQGLAWSVAALVVARLIVGVGVGVTSMVVPIYIAEIAPTELRGKLVSINSCMISSGIAIAGLFAGVASYDEDSGWRYMLGLPAIPALLMMLGFVFMPESPRFLVKNNQNELAKKVLLRLRNDDEEVAAEELDAIVASSATEEGSVQKSSLAKIWRNRAVRRALLLGGYLQFTQQFTGVNTVLYYSATIVQMSGVYQKSRAVWFASGGACIDLIFTSLGMFLVGRTARRKILLSSLAGTILALVALASAFYFNDLNTPSLSFASDSLKSNDSCAAVNIDSCFDCVEMQECGFCFKSGQSGVNGTCLPANGLDGSTLGECATESDAVDAFVWARDWCPTKYSWTILIGLFSFSMFFGPGIGPLTWVINSEIYPLWARGTCCSITTAVAWWANFVVTMTFLSISEMLTKASAFLIYAAFGIVGFVVFYLYLPETKDLTLENVESAFEMSRLKQKRKEKRQKKCESTASEAQLKDRF